MVEDALGSKSTPSSFINCPTCSPFRHSWPSGSTSANGVNSRQQDGAEGTPDLREWAYDRCFMLTGHGPSESLVEQVLHGNLSHDDLTWEAVSRPGVYVCGALSPHHYHLGHIGLLKSPVYNAPELTVAGGNRTDQTRLSLRVRERQVSQNDWSGGAWLAACRHRHRGPRARRTHALVRTWTS